MAKIYESFAVKPAYNSLTAHFHLTLVETKKCILFPEEGLEVALKATAALYDQTAESLMQLRAEDISSVFEGAKTCELLLQPGTTTLDVALQAGCFTNESKCSVLYSRIQET
jgi:hypothetical protein